MIPHLIAALAAVALLAPPPPDPTNSIVKLTMTGSICTGVVVRPTQVLSAEHCAPTGTDDLLVDDKPAKVIKRSESLILIDVPGLVKPGIPVGKLPKRGDAVDSWGYAYNLGLALMKRSVSNFLGPDLMLDGPIAGGMSGGPVIDHDGKLVGINQGTEKVNFASSIVCGPDEIKEFLSGK